MYTKAFSFALALDFFAIVASWVSAEKANSDYFIDHITHFHFRTSVFDLVVLAALRLAVCLPCVLIIARLTTESGSDPYNAARDKKIFRHRLAMVLTLLASTVYLIVKAVLVLLWQLKPSVGKSNKMDIYYLVGLGVTGSLCLLEDLFCAYNWSIMRKLQHRTIMSINDDEETGKADEPKEKTKVDWIRILSLAKSELSLLLPGVFFLLISTASTALAPRYFGFVVDATKKGQAAVNEKITYLTVIFMVGSVAAMIRSYLFTVAGQRLVARVRIQLYKAIIDQEVAFFDTNRTGDLTNRLSSDTQVLQNALTVNVSMLLRNVLSIAASVGFMMALSWKLTLVLLSVVPVIAIGAVQYGMILKKLRKAFQDKLGEASTVADEAISSIRTVRSFSNEEKAKKDYSKHIDESYLVGKKLSQAIAIFTGVVSVISQGAIALVLWYGAKLVVDVKISPGVLFSFMLYTITIAAAFATITTLFGEFMQAVGASARLFELIDRKPELNSAGGLAKDTLHGSVDFKDVRFTYPSRLDTEVLKGVSFSVQPGTVVALVGPSGGGKSTVVSLIERFYDPMSGTILLGNSLLSSLDPLWFRQHVAMVGQEPVLFAYTIAENIAYGRQATREEIVEAAKKANAHEFIMNFKDGYDTAVGERGVRLSGGQKQRVAIARALLMDPTILLLDEATSALDAESEFLVQDAIDRAMKDRTVLVIAHRLSTVRDATKVLVMDNGQIVEEGSHDELISANGVYKRLVLRQLASHSAELDDTAAKES